jgi:hypothetical protein
MLRRRILKNGCVCHYVKLKLSFITFKAALAYDAFTDVYWRTQEVVDRPPLEERIKRIAKHWAPWLHRPGMHCIKAVHAETGELVSIGCWLW